MSYSDLSIHPKLTLVGAGPGDPELITLKGIRALKEARVVLYDALVNTEILDYAPANALKRFVGKRAGLHLYSQDEINQLIVSYALSFGRVVRLKGGDPFVFGRGYEEIAFAESYNIETEVIPGISSAIALPELKKIPLTTRGVNESFWVLTGTTSNGKLSADIYHAARTNATVVVLMGLKKLGEIAKVYEEAGKRSIAIGVIASGSLPEERFVTGTAEDIEKKVKEADISGPAIIVIGEAVNLHLGTGSARRRIVEELLQEVA